MSKEKNNLIDQLYKLDKQARDFGFKWPNNDMIIDQIISECQEIKEALSDKEHMQEEIGDLLHACFSLCFFNKMDPEIILQQAILKFSKRFESLKNIAQLEGCHNLNDQPIEELLRLWKKAKCAQ